MVKEVKPKDDQGVQLARWQVAREKHLHHINIDKVIQNETSAEPYQYSVIFEKAAKSRSTKAIHKPAFSMLSAIMLMYIPDDLCGSEFPQFRPFFQWNDGSRSAESSDFNTDQMETIRKCTKITQNLIVKTRLEHLVWDVDRSDREAGHRAIDGYIDILQEIYTGNFSVRGDLGSLSATSENILGNLTDLYRHLDCPDVKKKNVKSVVKKFFRKAYMSKDILCVLRFSRIAVKFDQNYVISLVEKFIEGNEHEVSQSYASLWSFLADTYYSAGDISKYEKCKTEEAEIYAAMAIRTAADGSGRSLNVANLLEKALAAYEGIPGIQNRYVELRRQLVDIEKRIPTEMKKFSSTTDLSEDARATIDEFRNLDFNEALMIFKSQSISLDSEQTMALAKEVISEFPIHAMFHSELRDDDGKIIAESSGASVGADGKTLGDFDPVIMRNEAERRGAYEMGFIDPARTEISNNHRVSKKKIIEILRQNPLLPPSYVATLSEGFERYFNGDWVAAAYILIPMLEAVVISALRRKGYSVHDRRSSRGKKNRLLSLSRAIRTRRSEIANVYDEKIAEDIYRLFFAKWGPAIRHSAVHALHNGNLPYTDSARYACWIIWRLATFHLTYKAA